MVSVNLIPASVLIRYAVRRRVQNWIIAGVILGAAVTVPVVVEGRQQARVQRLRGEITVLEGKLGELRGQVARTAQGVLDTDAQLARGRALRTKRGWASLLALVGGCVPEEAWLTSIATDPPAPTGSVKQASADWSRKVSAAPGAGTGVEAGVA